QRARVVEWSLPQGEQSYAAAAVRRRIIVLQALCDRGYLGLGLLRSDARFEPHEALDPAGAAIFQFVSARGESLLHRYRDPELHGPADERAVETLRRNADYRVRHTVEHLRPADDRRIAVEPLIPHLVANDGNGMSITAEILGGFEAPPEDGTNSQRIE